MEIERWQQIEEIIVSAIELPNAERRAFLDENCNGDEDLRREVESLLARQTDDFLEPEQLEQIIETVFDSTESSLIGKQIGNYRILREIGAGGMGAVFLAERADGEFSQKVAVKIIRLGFDSGEIRRRFLHERQILAGLEHPNIARLLDGGTTADNLPFLVMEYVEGLPVTKFCQTEKLLISERLKVFLKVCNAVSYAHQNLVVHRDLKPSNIFVTKEGDVKLLDFGIAKLLDNSTDSKQTQTDFRAFTPDYASPEQIRGEKVTTSSDVYSLGALLYELLTGNLPYRLKGRTLEEISKAILTENPSRPSASRTEKNSKFKIQNSKIKIGDLDNITLTALRKEPSRRYASVQQFAEDIERYLNKKPILARPNTFRYVAGKFIRRNKFGVLAAGLILLSLTAGIIVSVWQSRVAAAQRDRAESRFNDVRKLSSSLLFEISPQIERLPGSTQARETIVRRALEYLDSLATESANNESLQSELASAYEQVGDVQGKPGKANLGDLKGATESYRKAQQIRLVLAEKYPDDLELKKLLAANYYSIGELLWWSNKTDEALENYRRALGISEDLAAREPENPAAAAAVIHANFGIATVLASSVDRRQSIPLYRQIILRLNGLQAKNPSDIELQRLSEIAHVNLAYDLSWEDEMKEAAEEAQTAVEIGEPLLAANPNDAQVRRALWLTYFFAGGVFEEVAPERSRQYLEKSIVLVKRTVETDAVDFQAKHDLAQSYSELSVIAANEKKFDEAVKLLEKSQIILDELTAAEPRHGGYKLNSANNFFRLGDAQAGKGDLTNALQSYEQALALHNKMHEADPTDNMPLRNIGISSQKIAEMCEKLEQFDKAAEYDQKGLEIFALFKEKNALDDYDKKTVEDLQKSLDRIQGEKLMKKYAVVKNPSPN